MFVSSATEGARNMTGRVQGAVTYFQNLLRPVFVHISCGSHQLDLFVQNIKTGCLKDTFRAPMVSIIFSTETGQSQTRNGYHLFCNFNDKMVFSWIRFAVACSHRFRITVYIYQKQPSHTPSRPFWPFTASIKQFLDPVDKCFKAIQG